MQFVMSERFTVECAGMYLFLHFEYMTILCGLNNSLVASHKIGDRSLNNNLSAKTKWQKGLAQCAVFCRLVSYRKSASFVSIVFTEIKRNLAINFQ